MLLNFTLYTGDPRPDILPVPPPPLDYFPGFNNKDIPEKDIPEVIEKQHEWSTYTIDYTLRKYRAPAGDPIVRRLALTCLDAALHYYNPEAANSGNIEKFLERRYDLAAFEMENTKVTENAVLWKIYNMGYIIRTPYYTLAFDLTRGYWGNKDIHEELENIVKRIIKQSDALFVSNPNPEFNDTWVIENFLQAGKPVISLNSLNIDNKNIINPVRDGTSITKINLSKGNQVQFITFPGHNVQGDNNIYLIITPQGHKYCHTGKQNNSEDFTWIDKIKNSHKINILIANNSTKQMQRMVEGFNPHILLTGNENEMSQKAVNRLGHFITFDRLQNIDNTYFALTWGDSFYYDPKQKYTFPENNNRQLPLLDDPRPNLLPTARPVSEISPEVIFSDINRLLDRQLSHCGMAVDAFLRKYPPVYPSTPERRMALMAYDELLHYNEIPKDLSNLNDIYRRRLEAISYEIMHTDITQGAVVWKFYNMGVIVRTPSQCLAFDIIRSYFGGEDLLLPIIKLCDALFISHDHEDHIDGWVVDRFKELGKPVIGPWCGYENDGKTINTIKLPEGNSLRFVAYLGYQGAIENLVPIIFTPEGINICQTGDLFQSNSTPVKMYETWMKDLNKHWDIDILLCREYHFSREWQWAFGFDPEIIITGHENEVSHKIKRKPHCMNFEYSREKYYPVIEMTWGDSYYYKKGKTPSTLNLK